MIDDRLWIIPDLSKNNRSLKIVFDDLSCPKNSSIRCKYAENKSDDMNFIIRCENYEKEGCLI